MWTPNIGWPQWWWRLSIIPQKGIPNYGWGSNTSRFTNDKESPGKTSKFLFVYTVKLIKGWNQSWNAFSWTMNHLQCTPNMLYLVYCACIDVKFFSRIWSPRNRSHFWNPWRRQLKSRYEDLLWVQERLAIYYSMLEKSLWVSYIPAGFLWPTRHRVVSTIYGMPVCRNWQDAEDTPTTGTICDGREA